MEAASTQILTRARTMPNARSPRNTLMLASTAPLAIPCSNKSVSTFVNKIEPDTK